MNESQKQVSENYKWTLRDFLNGAGEASLQQGYQIGRKSVQVDLGILQILEIHHQSLKQKLQTSSPECLSIVAAADEFLATVLSPYEMTHRGYQDSIRRLQHLNEELESFNYTVSHDLRTPVRTISGFTRILLEHHRAELNPEAQELLDRIMTATDQMESLIEGLLTLARLDRQNLSNDPVNLSQTVQDILQDFQRLSPQRKLEVHVEPNLKVKGDYPLLHTAISNLLANAWKFTGKKEESQIEFGQTQIQGRPAYFVHDNGAGFDMRYAQSLFNPFQRLHSKEQFDGIGIGLATTRRIIERHGGRIWAEAKPGEGATFYFTLEKPAST